MSDDTHGLLTALAQRHGIAREEVHRLTQQGEANDVYAVGRDLIARIARPGHERDLAAEAVVIPIASAAGMPVPDIVEHHSPTASSPAWMVQRRCPGVRLDDARLPPQTRAKGHRDLGRLLRSLHEAHLRVADDHDVIPDQPEGDGHDVVADQVAAGWLSAEDGRWLLTTFDDLGAASASMRTLLAGPLVIHGDASASNVLVDPDSGEVTALLDWGDTAHAAPSVDLAKVEPRDLAATVDGYAGTSLDPAAVEAAALVHHLAWALGGLGRAPRPGAPAWSGAPGSRLLGLLRWAWSPPGQLP